MKLMLNRYSEELSIKAGKEKKNISKPEGSGIPEYPLLTSSGLIDVRTFFWLRAICLPQCRPAMSCDHEMDGK